MKKIVIVSAMVVGLGMPEVARADFLCCDLISGGACAYAPVSLPQTLGGLSTACTAPDANGWVVAISVQGHIGGATVGARSSSPPWQGVCLHSKPSFGSTYTDPDFCVPIGATGGLQTVPVSGSNYQTDGYVMVGDNVTPKNQQGVRLWEMCFPGAQPRILPYPAGSTRVTGTTSCSLDTALLAINTPGLHYSYNWMAQVPNLDLPAIVGTQPMISGPSTLVIGQIPSFTVTGAVPGASVFWTATQNGTLVENSFQLGNTDGNGAATVQFPTWTTSSVGQWVRSAVVGGFPTNQLTYTVEAVPMALQFFGASGDTVGWAPGFKVTNGPPNTVVQLTSTINGTSVPRFASAVTDGAGTATVTGPVWMTADIGTWVVQATAGSKTSNQLTFNVHVGLPLTVAAPALGSTTLLTLAASMLVVGVGLLRERQPFA